MQGLDLENLPEIQFFNTVIDCLDKRFNPLVIEKCKEYCLGTILHTLNGIFFTNATIIEVQEVQEKTYYVLLTDIGNLVRATPEHLSKYYHPPSIKRVPNI